MTHEAGPVRMPLRVRFHECDPQGVVFNAHYLAYADMASFAGYPSPPWAPGIDSSSVLDYPHARSCRARTGSPAAS